MITCFVPDQYKRMTITSMDATATGVQRTSFRSTYDLDVFAPLNKFLVLHSGTHPEDAAKIMAFYTAAARELTGDKDRCYLPTRTRLICDLVDGLDRDIGLMTTLTDFVQYKLGVPLPTGPLSMGDDSSIAFMPSEYIELVATIMLNKFLFPIWEEFLALSAERNGVDIVVDPAYYLDMTTTLFPKMVDDKIFRFVAEACHDAVRASFLEEYSLVIAPPRHDKLTIFADLVTNGFARIDLFTETPTLLSTIRALVHSARDRAMSEIGI